jgi:hypothetical protein
MPYIRGLMSKEFLWSTADLAMWSVVEVGVSIIATAATTLRPLLSQTRQFTISPATLINTVALSGNRVIRIANARRKEPTEAKAERPSDEEALSRDSDVSYDESANKTRDWLGLENDRDIVFSNPWSKGEFALDELDTTPTSPDSHDADSITVCDFDGVDPTEIARAY